MELLEDATASLERMQTFDPAVLVRESDLGSAKNFSAAVEPAQRIIDLYKRLSASALQDFPEPQLKQVKERANGDHQLFQQVLDFDPDNTTADRDALVSKISSGYASTFSTLHPLIAYSLHRAADFQRLDAEARATLQSIQDEADGLTKSLEHAKEESKRILDEVRKTAAEAGVSQQAHFFKEAADEHDTKAERWRKRTINLAWATGGFAVLSLVIHKLPIIAPTSTYDTMQIAVSKILVFAVLTFILYLSARNFLSHKHNAVVNRHRQHALQTYQALVDAAGDSGKSDIVLTHATACIFGPQATGYAAEKQDGGPSAQTVVELLGTMGERGRGAT
jgi:hypothetical protein